MTKRIPIKEKRDTATFFPLVENLLEPTLVTKSSSDQCVVLQNNDYDQVHPTSARAHLIQRILIAEEERKEEFTLDAYDSLTTIKNRYNL